MSSLVQESLSVSGILLGKTMGRSGELAERFEGESNHLADLEVRSRMTGRWLMQSIQMTFAIMPAAIYWFGGLAVHNAGPDRLVRRRRHARRVHDAADAALRADREPALDLRRRPELARALRPDLRVPRPAGRHRAGHADARDASSGDVRHRGRLVPLRRRALRARGDRRHDPARARRRRSSARPAPARRRSATSSRGSTTRRRAGSRSTASTSATSPSSRSRPTSASSRRRPTSSTRPSARTSASRSRTRPTRRSRRRRARRRCTT